MWLGNGPVVVSENKSHPTLTPYDSKIPVIINLDVLKYDIGNQFFKEDFFW